MTLEFSFRALTLDDLPQLHEWLNRPHVAEWWEGRPLSFEEVERSFGPDIDSPLIFPMMVTLNGVPIGFAQWYRVMGADPEWWTEETDPGARGIDQFLANVEQIGQGLGSRMVRQLVAQLFSDPNVTKVQTDPAPDNARAIRAYEKAGFRRVAELITPDGPALLMVIHRAEFELSSS